MTVRFTFLFLGAGGPAAAAAPGFGAAGFFEGLPASAGPTSPEG
jgi:hypothetical protein